MVEPTQTPSIVVDLIGDLDDRLGEMAAATLLRLDGDRPVVLSLRNLSSVHSDGFQALVRAIKSRTDFGRPTAIVSNGKQTQTMLSEAHLDGFVVSHASVEREPSTRRLLLARHTGS